MAGVVSDVYMAANPSIATTNETANNTDSGAWIVYQASVHWAWDKRVGVTVQTSPNGTSGWAVATDYVFEYAGGVIVFNTPRVSGTNNFVRIATGNYFNLTELDLSHTWTLSLKATVADTTSFQAPGAWAVNTPTIRSGTAKVDTFRSDGRMALELGNLVAMQFYIDLATNMRWDILGWVDGIDPKSDIKGVVEEALSVTIEGDCYLRLV